eukprot:5879497-Ditylum_brightwellii.AAC.1
MEYPQPCVVSSWGLPSFSHLGGYTSAEYVASIGNLGNHPIVLSTDLIRLMAMAWSCAAQMAALVLSRTPALLRH